MPLPILADHFRTISEFSNIPAGKNWTVCMDFDATEAANPVTDEDVAIGMIAAWAGFFSFVISAQDIADRFNQAVALQQVTVYDLTADKAPWVEGGVTVEGDGTTALPPDVALVVSKRTGTRGRRGRGRFYLGGLSTTAMASGGTGLVEDVESWMEAATEAFLPLTVGGIGVESDLPMVVISQAEVPTGEAYPVSQLVVDQHFDTQRRRGLA